MKKRITVILLFAISISLIVSAFLLNGKQKEPQKEKKEPIPKLVENYSLPNQEHHFNNFHFSDFIVIEYGDKYQLFVSMVNEGEPLTNDQLIEVILLNDKGKEITRISDVVPVLQKEESYQFVQTTSVDITKAVDFKVEFKGNAYRSY